MTLRLQTAGTIDLETPARVPVKVLVSPLPVDVPDIYGQFSFEPIALPWSGNPDAQQILSALFALGLSYGTHPLVRQVAEKIMGAGHRDNDLPGAVRKLESWVKANLRYMPDPHNLEMVTGPVQFLERWLAGQPVIGDCDDHVLLFNSLCLSLGIPAKPKAVRLGDSSWYDHVISQVNTGNGWRDIDLCAKEDQAPEYLNQMELLS